MSVRPWEVCEQENDLIVMSTGDGRDPFSLFETPDLDVAALRKEWCRRYCKANKMHILQGDETGLAVWCKRRMWGALKE